MWALRAGPRQATGARAGGHSPAAGLSSGPSEAKVNAPEMQCVQQKLGQIRGSQALPPARGFPSPGPQHLLHLLLQLHPPLSLPLQLLPQRLGVGLFSQFPELLLCGEGRVAR